MLVKMQTIFEGIRVIELSMWVAGPAAAGLMADWGADVIKIEAPSGDPQRSVFGASSGMDGATAPPFNLDNRGKRSIVLDLRTEGGREAASRLIDGADVFITNMRQRALTKLGLDPETLRTRNPRLVYACVTGYGRSGPESDRAAYDVGAFWARSGIAHLLSRSAGDPSPCRPALGDHVTGITLLSGISAALFKRERTGAGGLVETSLLRTGMYTIGWDIGTHIDLGWHTKTMSRSRYRVPLVNCYKTGDERWLWLLGLEAVRHWPKVLRAVERTDLETDPDYATPGLRSENCQALIALLDLEFAKRPLAEWATRLDAEDLWWSPVQTLEDVIADPQAHAAGAFVEVEQPGGQGKTTAVAGPVDFAGYDTAPKGPPPRLGEHTHAVLAEAGFNHAEIQRIGGAEAIGTKG